MEEKPNQATELLELSSGKAEHVYYWHCGYYTSRFLLGLRDQTTILGVRCSACGRVYVPPREVCGRCFKTMNEWVDLGTEGTIYAFTVVKLPYVDPNTGLPIKVPRTDIYVQFDGADTRLMHWLDEGDETKIKVGARVKAVFKKERRGTIHDIEYFTQV